MQIRLRQDYSVWLLLLLSLAYAMVVYAYPMVLESDVFEAFDSFSYVGYLNENPVDAREAQGFLWLYPHMVFSAPALHVYAAFLHFFLLVPVCLIAFSLSSRADVGRLLLGMCAAESVLFLGTASKEGLAIVAVFSCLCAHLLLRERRNLGAVALVFYACLVGEISRPKFGILIGAGFVVSLAPYMSVFGRQLLGASIVSSVCALAWYLLVGPGAEDFSERYEIGKAFLAWFEVELASTSPLKAAVRDFFTLAFSADEPSLWFLVLVFLLSIAKAIVYLLAVPLISPPIFTLLPAQEWAICWQVAVSMMTLMVVWGLYSVIVSGDVDSCHSAMLIFSLVLVYFLALSTFIFHVRYRAPGMMGLIATLLCMRKISPISVVLSSAGLCVFMLGYSTFWFA